MILYMWRMKLTMLPQIECISATDTALSVILIRRFYEPGEFEIVLPASEELFGLLTDSDSEIFFTGTENYDVFFVEKIKLKTDTEEGDKITVSGRTADSRLCRRVINYRETAENVPPEALMMSLIKEHFEAPASRYFGSENTWRKEPLITVKTPESTLYSDPITAEFLGENVLDVVNELRKLSGSGLSVTFESGKFIYELYKGRDKTDSVVFSPEYGNLVSTEYERDKHGDFNAVYICETNENNGKPKDTVEYARTAGTSAYGARRAEKWFTAQNIPNDRECVKYPQWGDLYVNYSSGSSSSISPDDEKYGKYISFDYLYKVKNTAKIEIKFNSVQNFENAFIYLFYYNKDREFIRSIQIGYSVSSSDIFSYSANVPNNVIYINVDIALPLMSDETIHPDSVNSCTITTDVELTDAERENLIKEQGEHELAAFKKNETFFGEIVENGLYTIGVDYDLGDLVRIENTYGISATARVTEINEVEDGEGYRIYPGFSDITII